jgi:hypothetical protein
MNHKHIWKKTGGCRYSCPAQYEMKCECGKIKWVEEELSIPVLSIEESKKRYPQLYK